MFAEERFVTPGGEAGLALVSLCRDPASSASAVRDAIEAVAGGGPEGGFDVGRTHVSFDGGGATALHVAAEAGAEAAVEAVLGSVSEASREACANAEREDGATPLALASAGGHLKIVRQLLSAGAAVRPPRGLDGGACFNSPMAAAAQHGHVDVLRALLEHGGGELDVDKDVTPLFGDDEGLFAELSKQLELKDAEEREAAAEMRRVRAQQAREAAAKHQKAYEEDHKDDAEDEEDGVIRDGTSSGSSSESEEPAEGEKNPRRWSDSEESDEEDLEDKFRPQGVRPRPKRHWWPGRGQPREGRAVAMPMSPLYWGAWSGHAECVRLLLERGADADRLCLVITATSTPLYVACWGGHADVVRALLEGGASPGAALPPEGRFPLWRAAQYGHAECCSLLLDAGADVNQRVGEDRESGGSTALWRAAQFGQVDVIRVLLAAGADVSLPTRSPPTEHVHTPVEVAAWSGQGEALRVLLAHGGVPSAEAIYRARLMKRVSEEHQQCEEILLAAGAPPENDPWEQTPEQRSSAEEKAHPRVPVWPPAGRADLADSPRDPNVPNDARVSLNPDADWF